MPTTWWRSARPWTSPTRSSSATRSARWSACSRRARAPGRIGSLVLVGPSPRYIDDEGYRGGFSRDDIEELLASLDSNFLGWSSAMAPVIMGNTDRPELGEELTASFCRTDPEIAARFARVTFMSDNRADLGRVDRPHAGAAVQRRRDRPAGGRRLRPPADPRLPPRPARGHGALPEPERTAGDDRRHPCLRLRWRCLRRERRRPLRERTLRISLDSARRHDRARQRDVPALDRATRARSLVGVKRFQDLLTVGGRIYHETHYAPLLRMQGHVREIAVDVVAADGRRLPVLVNSVLLSDDAGEPRVVRTTVFDARERQSYERELVAGPQGRDRIERLQRITAVLAAAPDEQAIELVVTGELGAERGTVEREPLREAEFDEAAGEARLPLSSRVGTAGADRALLRRAAALRSRRADVPARVRRADRAGARARPAVQADARRRQRAPAQPARGRSAARPAVRGRDALRAGGRAPRGRRGLVRRLHARG